MLSPESLALVSRRPSAFTVLHLNQSPLADSSASVSLLQGACKMTLSQIMVVVQGPESDGSHFLVAKLRKILGHRLILVSLDQLPNDPRNGGSVTERIIHACAQAGFDLNPRDFPASGVEAHAGEDMFRKAFSGLVRLREGSPEDQASLAGILAASLEVSPPALAFALLAFPALYKVKEQVEALPDEQRIYQGEVLSWQSILAQIPDLERFARGILKLKKPEVYFINQAGELVVGDGQARITTFDELNLARAEAMKIPDGGLITRAEHLARYGNVAYLKDARATFLKDMNAEAFMNKQQYAAIPIFEGEDPVEDESIFVPNLPSLHDYPVGTMLLAYHFVTRTPLRNPAL